MSTLTRSTGEKFEVSDAWLKNIIENNAINDDEEEIFAFASEEMEKSGLRLQKESRKAAAIRDELMAFQKKIANTENKIGKKPGISVGLLYSANFRRADIFDIRVDGKLFAHAISAFEAKLMINGFLKGVEYATREE